MRASKLRFSKANFTRLEKADDALKVTIIRAVSQGIARIGLRQRPERLDRVWFKEPVELADITFDYDTYLLTAAKAKALKQAPMQPLIPAPVTPAPSRRQAQQRRLLTPTGTPASAQATPKEISVSWQGQMKREQWNLFSLKVLTRLAQADDVQIEVKVSAKLKEAQTLEQLNAALKELGITDQFEKR